MKNHYQLELIHTFIKKLDVNVIDPIAILEKKHYDDAIISPLGIKSRKLARNNYEVVGECSIMIEGTQEEIILSLKIEFSGIFDIKLNSSEESLKKIIYVDCATLIYPFLRAEVTNLTAKLGMVPINLPYIDFYEQFYKINRRISAESRQIIR